MSGDAELGTCDLCGQEMIRTADDCWHPHTVAKACPPEPSSVPFDAEGWRKLPSVRSGQRTPRPRALREDGHLMATPIRLPLSQRQAEALAMLLDEFGVAVGNTETQQALREVAEKLGTLRTQQ